MKRGEGIFGHWSFPAGLILLAAALTIPQLDKYTISLDAINSYTLALGVIEDARTAADVVGSLYSASPDQAPLYFMLLHYWGKIGGHSLAAARLPALLAGMLSLAMVYRLARDFIAPQAGSFAVLILLCNSFYAFYFAHLRYYTFVLFLAALTIWLYLRLVSRPHRRSLQELAAIAVSSAMLLVTHAFTVALCIALSLYHLLSARKGIRWLQIVLAGLVGVSLALPHLATMLTAGLSSASAHHGPRSDSLGEVLAAWLGVISNGAPVLLAVSLVGAVIGWRRGTLRGNPFLLLFPLLVVAIGISTEATGVVSQGQMRYFLVGAPIVVCFAATGLYALYRLRAWLALLALAVLALRPAALDRSALYRPGLPPSRSQPSR